MAKLVKMSAKMQSSKLIMTVQISKTGIKVCANSVNNATPRNKERVVKLSLALRRSSLVSTPMKLHSSCVLMVQQIRVLSFPSS